MNTLRKALTENGGLTKLHKALKLIKEESSIADRGEFHSSTDIQYLREGFMNLQEFCDILDDMMRNEEHKNVKIA